MATRPSSVSWRTISARPDASLRSAGGECWARRRLFGDGCVLVDEVLSLGESELDELSRSGDPMGWLGVLELSLHGGDEEADDEPAVVGLLSDDFSYRRRVLAFGVFLLAPLQVVVGVFFGEHMR